MCIKSALCLTAPATTKVWFWREFEVLLQPYHRVMQCLRLHRSLRATCTPTSSRFPSSNENGKTFQSSRCDFLKHPVSLSANNLQCLTSTLCYLSPATAVADDKLGQTGASSCPDLLGLMLPLLWYMGCSQDVLRCLRYGQNHCTMDLIELQDLSLQTDTFSPTSSVSSEISSCRCCADSRGPLSGYFS